MPRLARRYAQGATAHVGKGKPRGERIEPPLDGGRDGAASINGTRGSPALSADLFGDWRAEVVQRSRDNDAPLVYSTTMPTRYRIPPLKHDPQYRVQVAGRDAGYKQPPQPSLYLGDGMAAALQPMIHVP